MCHEIEIESMENVLDAVSVGGWVRTLVGGRDGDTGVDNSSTGEHFTGLNSLFTNGFKGKINPSDTSLIIQMNAYLSAQWSCGRFRFVFWYSR